MAFNLENYQTVKQRKDLFMADHAHGVILAVPTEVTDGQASFTVGVWVDKTDMKSGAERLSVAIASGAQISDVQSLLLMAPDSLGTAFEAKWMTGASKTSWTENCEESAIGRALDNLGYHGNGKCSREEVLKAQEAERQLKTMARKNIEDNPHPAIDPVELPQEYPDFNALVGDHSRKKGIKQLRNVGVIAKSKGWTQDELFKWITSQGVDLADSGLKFSDFAKLNAMIKGA